MNKNENKSASVIITIIALAAIIFSGWLILNRMPVAASSMCKTTVECPDGRKISCEGTSCESNESDKDPYCIGDGEITRCSDKNKDEGDKDKTKDKKKDKKNSNSNANSANTPAANGNNQ